MFLVIQSEEQAGPRLSGSPEWDSNYLKEEAK